MRGGLFSATYKDHHWWNLDVNEIMGAAGLPTSQTIHEDITINSYTDTLVKIQ